MAGLILAGNLLTGAQDTAAAGQVASQAGWAQAGWAQPGWTAEDMRNGSIPVVEEEAGVIPENAVRLRIMANSDSPEDQELKRKVRDRIIQEVGVRLRGIDDHEEVREALESGLPELNQAAAYVIREAGYSYKVNTDYGTVPFPTKMYGDHVYPAGEYEALRIVIGEGQGQNWWCVLFPPLCFVDVANGDAVQAKDMDGKSKPVSTIQVPSTDNADGQTVQVRLGILDAVMGLMAKLSDFFDDFFDRMFE
jgi:stage II sporulation protein R